MKKIINLLSILGIVASPVALGVVYYQTNPSQAAAQQIEVTTKKNFPRNKSQIVNFEPNEGFEKLTERHKSDQFRDWLLLTVISGKGLSSEKISQGVYDLPTVRYDFMSPIASFEYGTTRSLDVGDGRIVALVPKTNDKTVRLDDIAHIADRHRKDQGEKPKFIEVFEYEIVPNQQAAIVTRRDDIDATKVFSSEYGYYETTIKSENDLQSFLNLVDDITFTQVTSPQDSSNGLTVGGRKIHSRKYQGIRVEDIAALWQSDNKIVNGSGFSLDPSFDYPGLVKSLEQAKPLLQSIKLDGKPVITDQDIQNAKQGLLSKDIVPYLKLIDKLQKFRNSEEIFKEFTNQLGNSRTEDLIQEISKFYQKLAKLDNFLSTPETQSFQSARYDGDLKGTEVGMVLFYTDLLAKLWALNYVSSTPYQNIPDFNPLTKVKVSSIYKKEIEKLPSTRVWFGPQDRGFQVANGGGSLLFARNATRIYAASSNPLKPGEETSAAADTNTFLSWWNDHYEEVARYEAQYERLNQIMKWSLVINWLNQSNQGDILSFLQGVSVKRDNWFPDWAQAQGTNVRFQKWQKVGFFNRGYKGTNTETMPPLASESFQFFGKTRFFQGGVSLGNISTFKSRTPLRETSDLSQIGRRSIVDYNSVIVQNGKLTFKNLEGTNTYEVKLLSETVSETTVKAKPEVKFRSADAELTNQEFSSKVAQTADGLSLETAIGDTEFGDLNITKTANGFKVGFESRAVDAGYLLTSRLSKHKGNILDALKEMDNVVSVKYSSSQPDVYFVQLSQSNNKWLKMSELPSGGGGGEKPPSKRGMDVGGLDDDARNFNLEWLDEAQVPHFPQSAGKGANNQQQVNFHKEADNLAQDPVPYLAYRKRVLIRQLKLIDVELKVGNNTKASRLIDESIKIYGREPNLILRKAVVDIRLGRLNAQPITPEGVKPGNQSFHDEINQLIANERYNFKAIETDKEFVYVQDSPGLNNLDFKQPIAQSVPFGSGARLYKLEPVAIGGVQISRSGFGDAGASSHASTQFKGTNPKNALKFRFNTLSDGRLIPPEECQENDDNQSNENPNCPKNQFMWW